MAREDRRIRDELDKSGKAFSLKLGNKIISLSKEERSKMGGGAGPRWIRKKDERKRIAREKVGSVKRLMEGFLRVIFRLSQTGNRVAGVTLTLFMGITVAAP